MHKKEDIFIHYDKAELQDEMEVEADEFSSNLLIPIEEYQEYIKMYSELNKRVNNMILQKLYYL